jgi:hypothetical protein
MVFARPSSKFSPQFEFGSSTLVSFHDLRRSDVIQVRTRCPRLKYTHDKLGHSLARLFCYNRTALASAFRQPPSAATASRTIQMASLRDDLVTRLEELPNVKVALWKDSDLLCVLYNNKEIAHFQNEHEIDIRLSPSIIRQKGLQPPVNTMSHLERSKNSKWIVQSFENRENLDEIVALIKAATMILP